MTDVQLFPLAACKISPENARQRTAGDVRGLRESIAAEGLLDPLHAYLHGASALIWDGGRRLRALRSLAKAKRLPPGLADGVPVLICEKEAARRKSLVTFVREGLHPAQEFRAYKALFDEGRDTERIAAAMGVDARRVAQLLRLSNLAPQIIDAFEAGDFGLDTAQAFTLADDHAKQRAALGACRDWISARRVRQLLTEAMMSSRDRLARFVGEEAYLAAGGGRLVDLFAQDDDADTWTDSGLVERLAREKLDAVVAEVKAEGWQWVTVAEPYDYGCGAGLQRIPREPAVVQDDDAGGDENAPLQTFSARPEAKIDLDEFTAEEKAGAGAIVQVDGGGRLTIARGYRKAQETPGASSAATAATAATADPELYGWGHTGHWHVTHVATAATRHALLGNPAAALDVLIAGLAWHLVAARVGGPPALKLEPKGVTTASIPAEARLAGEAAWEERRRAWRERIPSDDFSSCLAYVQSLGPGERAEILAIGVGSALDAVELRFDRRQGGAWAQLEAIAGHAGVKIEDAWKPDAAFLARGGKAALLLALGDTGEAASYAKAKKSEMVAVLQSRLEAQVWTPKLLRNFGQTPPETDETDPAEVI